MKFKEALSSTLAAAAIVLSPIHGLIIIISIAVATDTMCAIYHTIKVNGWRSFNSHKLFNIVPKTFLYMGTIIFAFLIDKFFFHGELNGVPFAVSKVVTAAWTGVELKSIDETRMKLGYKSMVVLAKDAYKNIRGIKKNLEDL